VIYLHRFEWGLIDWYNNTMNIFYLDKSITLCAQYHCDKHVIKMILESTQVLCSVLHLAGQSAPYRATHLRHPCVRWTLESLDNWLWLQDLSQALNQEYQFRFDAPAPHRSATIAAELNRPKLPAIGITERPQVMPEHYRIANDPVSAYRAFYRIEKQALLQYRKRSVPAWVLC